MKKILAILFTFFYFSVNAQKVNIIPTTAKDLLEKTKSNQYTLIYFCPTWCHSCMEKLPGIIKTAGEYPAIKLLLVCDPWSSNKKIQKIAEVVSLSDSIIYRLDKNVYKYGINKNIKKFTAEICPVCLTESGDKFRIGGIYLFNTAGDIIYYNKQADYLEELKETLKKY